MPSLKPQISAKRVRQASNWFWALVILAISGYLALVLIGAYVPWEVKGATALFGVLVVLWSLHVLWVQRHRVEIERDPRIRRARERRGF